MWNNNNPVQYSDPSGYLPFLMLPGLITPRQALAQIALAIVGFVDPVGLKSTELDVNAEAAADWVKSTPNVNKKLFNIATNLFRGETQEVEGGTAGAIRKELSDEGATVGSKTHLEKGAGSIRGLQKLLDSDTLTKSEATAAEAMLQSLKDAFGKVDPEQFIKNSNDISPTAPK